jgi:hypothetical protein
MIMRSNSRLSGLVAGPGGIRASRANTFDKAVSIRVAIGCEQVPAHVAVRFRARGIIAVRKMPRHRLEAAGGIKLLSGANDCTPAQPLPNTMRLSWYGWLRWNALTRLAAVVVALRTHPPTSTRADPVNRRVVLS